ncbi:uncharacterized protein TNCV_2443121 [Trichonephila clavipes]|nr:uncharacterized protein TNCV_2443121 [Trichonephila clavipes]
MCSNKGCQRLFYLVKQNPLQVVAHLTAQCIVGPCASVSKLTVQWTLLDMGTHNKRSPSGLLLIKRHCQLHLQWSPTHRFWILDNWKSLTRLRTPSTDHSSRIPPHHKKCTRTAYCFSGCHPGTGRTFTRGSCVFSNHTKPPAEGHLGSQRPLRVLLLKPTHQRLYLLGCRVRGNWTATKENQVILSDESRFNLTSDDNCVRVWRPRGERLNPAFALQ